MKIEYWIGQNVSDVMTVLADAWVGYGNIAAAIAEHPGKLF